MPNDDLGPRLLDEAKELDAPLEGQRGLVMEALRRHRFRHVWIVRTFTTLFWASAAAACLLATITRSETLLVATVLWLLLGGLVYMQSRLRHVELKIDEVLACLESRPARREDPTGWPPNVEDPGLES